MVSNFFETVVENGQALSVQKINFLDAMYNNVTVLVRIISMMLTEAKRA